MGLSVVEGAHGGHAGSVLCDGAVGAQVVCAAVQAFYSSHLSVEALETAGLDSQWVASVSNNSGVLEADARVLCSRVSGRRGSVAGYGTDTDGLPGPQWALGMLLYQLLSGTLPFWEAGESQSPFTVMTAILGGEVSFEGPVWDAISPHGPLAAHCSSHTDRES